MFIPLAYGLQNWNKPDHEHLIQCDIIYTGTFQECHSEASYVCRVTVQDGNSFKQG